MHLPGTKELIPLQPRIDFNWVAGALTRSGCSHGKRSIVTDFGNGGKEAFRLIRNVDSRRHT